MIIACRILKYIYRSHKDKDNVIDALCRNLIPQDLESDVEIVGRVLKIFDKE